VSKILKEDNRCFLSESYEADKYALNEQFRGLSCYYVVRVFITALGEVRILFKA